MSWIDISNPVFCIEHAINQIGGFGTGNNVSFGGATEGQICVLVVVDWSSWTTISGKS